MKVVTDVGVTSEMEADWRGLVGYLVKCLIHDVPKLTVRELDIPRITEENSTLNSQIRLKFPFSVPGSLVLPETFSFDNLNAYINMFMATDTLQTSQLFEDFTAINYKDCFEVKWLQDMTTLPTVSEAALAMYVAIQAGLSPNAARRTTGIVMVSSLLISRKEDAANARGHNTIGKEIVDFVLNRLLAQAISSLTATFRFDGALNVDVTDPRTLHLSDVRDHLHSLGQRRMEVVLPRT